MNAQHSSKSELWYTPSEVMDRVHKTIGYPDLDPASDQVANLTVRAVRYLTKDDDGLNALSWKLPKYSPPETVFLNPPGGKIGNQSQAALFWDVLRIKHMVGVVEDSIFIGFSLDFLQVHQGTTHRRMEEGTLICIPRKRIRFDSGTGEKATSPTHSNCIIYQPGTCDRSKLFRQQFQDLGLILSR